ncbi:centromere protein F-like isoform X1, partial [Tachysurus ichikawai]
MDVMNLDEIKTRLEQEREECRIIVEDTKQQKDASEKLGSEIAKQQQDTEANQALLEKDRNDLEKKSLDLQEKQEELEMQ